MDNAEEKLLNRISELERENSLLRESASLTAGRTALAWIGLVGAAKLHDLNGEVGRIRNYVFFVRHILETGMDKAEALKILEDIDDAARRIADTAFTPPLVEDERLSKVQVNELLRELVEHLRYRLDTLISLIFWRSIELS